MLYGCCTTIDNYDFLEKCGYDSITLAACDIAKMSKSEFSSVEKKIKDGRLKALDLNSFCDSQLKLAGRGYSTYKIRDYSEKLMERVALLGIKYIGIGAPMSRNVSEGESEKENLQQLMASLGIISEIAQMYGVDILLEAVCSGECNLVTTTKSALRTVRDLDIRNLHIVFDIYHSYMMNEKVDVIFEAADEIKVVHIAQSVNNKRGYLRRSNIVDYERYIKALIKINYDGVISLESFFGDFFQGLPESLCILKNIEQRLASINNRFGN